MNRRSSHAYWKGIYWTYHRTPKSNKQQRLDEFCRTCHYHDKHAILYWPKSPSGRGRIRPPRAPSQDWNTFLKNHAHDVWACDFPPMSDLFFRTGYVFFIVDLGSRRVVHLGTTRHPADAWTAQQLREATPFGQAPRFLIRDRDRKYGQTFTRVAAGRQIEILNTPYRAPKANAICERFLGSVRRKCLDHMLIVGEKHVYRVIKEYVLFFNQARPHPGIGQNIPARSRSDQEEERKGKVIAFPILNGLHHDYQRAA